VRSRVAAIEVLEAGWKGREDTTHTTTSKVVHNAVVDV
jgi:hypothetical protein